jgi:hypothetical protein
MTILAFQSAIVVLLILLNGLFAMSETALVSARKAGLRQRAESGDGRALYALDLADFAAIRALPNGDTVYALEPAKAPDGVDVAAVSRY